MVKEQLDVGFYFVADIVSRTMKIKKKKFTDVELLQPKKDQMCSSIINISQNYNINKFIFSIYLINQPFININTNTLVFRNPCYDPAF